jgi:hypothetical protein
MLLETALCSFTPCFLAMLKGILVLHALLQARYHISTNIERPESVRLPSVGLEIAVGKHMERA